MNGEAMDYPMDDPIDDPLAEPGDDERGGLAGGRHPVNIGHLVMGLAFLGLVVVWALIQTDTVSGEDVRWLMPLPWVVAGAAGLLASTWRGRRT